MSGSLSLPKPTWHIVLPWLEQLGPEQALALQRMGGPAQWWLHETPQETSARRPYMDDVFDLLASFLGWGEELEARPLHVLLPSLPQQMPTAQLELETTALDVLQAVGGTTLADAALLTPSAIACLAKVRTETKRDILAALVRAAALFPQPQRSHDEPPHTPSPTELEHPDHAVPRWFISLDARQQDLITLHLCTPAPIPIDELAMRYRTMHAWMVQLLQELPQQLQSAALESPKLAAALHLFEFATQTPITRTDLMDHHPWLADRLPGSKVQVLELLLALHWSGSTDGTWLFSGSLAHARKLTINALGLMPGETLSLPTATRLLQDTGRPLKATEQWLGYCGLRVVGGQQVELASNPQPAAASMPATSTDVDYELAPPRPTTLPAPREGEAATTPPAAPSTNTDLPAGLVPGHALRIEEVLEQLRVFACQQRPGEQLADLLRDSEELPEPLRTLVARTLAAMATPDGWQLPDEAPGPDTHDDHAALPDQDSAAPATARRVSLIERAVAILEELEHPLDWPLLVERMGADVNARSLKSQISRDDRFVRSDVNSWALAQWGLRPYTSIKELIAQEVDRADGSIPTDELVAVLTREFTIAAASVRVAASSPPFTARNGMVRRLSDVHSEQPSTDATRPDDGPSADDLINLMGL